MKTEKITQDIQVRSSDPSTLHVARLRHPPKRVTGSNSRRSRPQRSEPEKKTPSGKETRETLKEMGFSGDGSSRSECQNECQNVSQRPMLLMSIGAVLVLLVLTHICARRILNLELLPQFNWRIPQIAIWAKGRHSNAPHLHSEGLNSSQIADHTCKVQQSSVSTAIRRGFLECMKLPGQSNKAISCGTCPTAQLPLRLVAGSHLEIRHSAC